MKRGTHHFGLLILLKEMPELCCLHAGKSHDFGLVALKLDRRLRCDDMVENYAWRHTAKTVRSARITVLLLETKGNFF
jgi:hypothetical protein